MLPTNNNNNNASAHQQAVKVYQSIPFWFDMYVLAFERRHFLPHTTIINKKKATLSTPFLLLQTTHCALLLQQANTYAYSCSLAHSCSEHRSKLSSKWTPELHSYTILHNYWKLLAREAWLILHKHMQQRAYIVSETGFPPISAHKTRILWESRVSSFLLQLRRHNLAWRCPRTASSGNVNSWALAVLFVSQRMLNV